MERRNVDVLAIRFFWALVVAALAAVLFAGCGSPTSPTAEETKWTFINATTAEEESAKAIWLEQAACMGYTDNLRAMTVEVFPGGFVCGNVFAAGCTYSGKVQVGRPYFEAAIGHEYIHVIEMEWGWPTDYNHTGPSWAKCDGRNRR